MNPPGRNARRNRVIDRLHRSRLGRYGWLMDSLEWLGCQYAGHEPFDDEPGRFWCRHCGAQIPARRA